MWDTGKSRTIHELFLDLICTAFTNWGADLEKSAKKAKGVRIAASN